MSRNKKLKLFDEQSLSNIKHLYVNEKYFLKEIANLYGVSSHLIKRRLEYLNVEVKERNRKVTLSEDAKMKMSKRKKEWYRNHKVCGHKPSMDSKYNNMFKHLPYNVELEWLMRFSYDKLKYLNKFNSRLNDNFNYQKFIEKFYYDEKFNMLYDEWKNTGDDYLKPSVDHIIPKSEGGDDSVDNLRIVSWFENFSRCNLSIEEWEDKKNNLEKYFI